MNSPETSVQLFVNSSYPMGLETDPIIVQVSIGARTAAYEVPNIHALESWRRLTTDPAQLSGAIAEEGLVSLGVYRNLTQARAGFQASLGKTGPPSFRDEIQSSRPIVEAATTVMRQLVETAMERAGVTVEQQSTVNEFIAERSGFYALIASIMRASGDKELEAMLTLFLAGELDTQAEELLYRYGDCLAAPYATDDTNMQAHSPRERWTVQDSLEGLKKLLEYANNHPDDDSLSDEMRNEIDEVLNKKPDFGPHWLDTLRVADWAQPPKEKLLNIA